MLHWQKENKTKEKLQTNNTYTETKENKECKQKKRKSLKTETQARVKLGKEKHKK